MSAASGPDHGEPSAWVSHGAAFVPATPPLTYAPLLFDALRQYAAEGVFRFAGDAVPAGFTLTVIMLICLIVPLIGFPFAVIGATAGASYAGSSRVPPSAPTRDGLTPHERSCSGAVGRRCGVLASSRGVGPPRS